MSEHVEYYSLGHRLARIFPNLALPTIRTLGDWVFGTVVAGSCGQRVVSEAVSLFTGKSSNTTRQRLRELFYEPKQKRGAKRTEFRVESCFVPLVRFVMSSWKSDTVVLAIDACNLRDRLTVLAVCIVYRGVAIPVAWSVRGGHQKGSWHKKWIRLLKLVRAAIPREKKVVVLCDAGITSARLFKFVKHRLRAVPIFRLSNRYLFKPDGHKHFRPTSDLVPDRSATVRYTGRLFKTNPLRCSLVIARDDINDEPWFLITDDTPATDATFFYAMRFWIEHTFRIVKSGGLQWQRNRMLDPRRAERAWIVLALVTLFSVESAQTQATQSFEEIISEGFFARGAGADEPIICTEYFELTKKTPLSLATRGLINLRFFLLGVRLDTQVPRWIAPPFLPSYRSDLLPQPAS